VLINALHGGGIQRVLLTLAREFAACGHRVDLVVCRARDSMLDEVPASVRLVPLAASHRSVAHAMMVRAAPRCLSAMAPLILAWKAPWEVRRLPALVGYLRREKPDALLAAHTPLNLTALWAKRLARSATRVVVSEHNALSFNIENRKKKSYRRAYPQLVPHAYGSAEAIVAVSNGAADDLAGTASLPRERIATIYNPVAAPEIRMLAAKPLAHPWFAPGELPVIVAAGRLADQKDFATLLRAFARVRSLRPARLVILGEGRARRSLQKLARTLRVEADVELPGWVANPFSYMARASVFALSSAWEGLSCVLIEAMACGCPVVSTDCPYGPAEVLEGGRYGPLVPVGDDAALAQAMLSVLDAPPEPDSLRARAALFSVDRAADRYLEVLLGVASEHTGH
jgi:glycosyltransferase involved in cell wall biosynthesis